MSAPLHCAGEPSPKAWRRARGRFCAGSNLKTERPLAGWKKERNVWANPGRLFFSFLRPLSLEQRSFLFGLGLVLGLCASARSECLHASAVLLCVRKEPTCSAFVGQGRAGKSGTNAAGRSPGKVTE